jgi:hypothetical protein
MIRELIQEVVGLSPYERRLLDMLKTGGSSSEKRMYKFAKRRVSLSKRFFLIDKGIFTYSFPFFLLFYIYYVLVGISQTSIEEERSSQGYLLTNESSWCIKQYFLLHII